MRELYYPTTPEQCIAPKQYLVKESQNMIGNVAEAIGYNLRRVLFLILLGVGGIGMLLCSLAFVADEMEYCGIGEL